MDEKRAAIAQGSKSFFLASLFFSDSLKESSWTLYRWCRFCDDEIDHAAPGEAKEKFATLHRLTIQAMSGHESAEPLFQDFGSLVREHEIPQEYPLDLLKGFGLDVDHFSPKDFEDLLLYCYHVAGVVGVMMCYLMRVSNPKAIQNAVDLGIAMQMTNIARDIQEDARIGRVYLPLSWLKEEEIDTQDIMKSEKRSHLYRVVEKLLAKSEIYYASGIKGLEYLPLRCAWTISIAAAIYRAIGRKILRQGITSLDIRTVVSLPEKLAWTAFGTLRILPLALKRLIYPWKAMRLNNLEESYEFRKDIS